MEIIRHCYAVIWSVTHLILPHTSSAVNRVFSYKTIAAAFRQATQFTDSIPQYQCLELAELNYKRALELADESTSEEEVLGRTVYDSLVFLQTFFLTHSCTVAKGGVALSSVQCMRLAAARARGTATGLQTLGDGRVGLLCSL